MVINTNLTAMDKPIKEKMQEKYKDFFADAIIFRGRSYYNNGNVINLYKQKDKKSYKSNVKSNNNFSLYNVEIILDGDTPKFSCTCPCIDNCKHEYATLMAIDNDNFTEVNLLDVPNEENINIKEFIDRIDETRLKKYLFDKFSNKSEIDYDDFVSNFEYYLPMKSREYFYNTLFNQFQLNITDNKIYDFLSLAKKSVENNNYEYFFLISSSIIDAAKESEFEFFEDKVFDLYNKIGTLIRISYRKSNKNLKSKIDKWINDIESKKYYSDIYLEDMIFTIKNS